MTSPRHDAGLRLSDHELEAMLERAAEESARRALSDVGLGGKDAVLAIHDMRSLLECIGFVRRTAVQTSPAPARRQADPGTTFEPGVPAMRIICPRRRLQTSSITAR